MKKRLLCIVICITLCFSVLPLTAWAATQISSVTITNVPTPYAGSKVPVAATVNTTGAQFYSMDWYDKTAGRFLESTDYFTENHVYEVQLWVEAKSGYEFRTNGDLAGPVDSLSFVAEGLGEQHLRTILYGLGRGNCRSLSGFDKLVGRTVRRKRTNLGYILITPPLSADKQQLAQRLRGEGSSLCVLTGEGVAA